LDLKASPGPSSVPSACPRWSTPGPLLRSHIARTCVRPRTPCRKASPPSPGWGMFAA